MKKRYTFTLNDDEVDKLDRLANYFNTNKSSVLGILINKTLYSLCPNEEIKKLQKEANQYKLKINEINNNIEVLKIKEEELKEIEKIREEEKEDYIKHIAWLFSQKIDKKKIVEICEKYQFTKGYERTELFNEGYQYYVKGIIKQMVND